MNVYNTYITITYYLKSRRDLQYWSPHMCPFWSQASGKAIKFDGVGGRGAGPGCGPGCGPGGGRGGDPQLPLHPQSNGVPLDPGG